jgi:hypothetical protein
MDILCRRCGEPWDNDELHYLAEENCTTYQEEAARFRREGCGAFGTRCEVDDQAENRGMLTDLLGDDMDGLAATFEDLDGLL